LLCEQCGKREAVYHTTTNINGALTETNLCAECQSLKATDIFKGIGGLFNMLGGVTETAEKEKRRRLICHECGTTFDDFTRSGGYLGCENCYKEFAPLLRPIILQTQGKIRHTGKIPDPSPEDKRAAEIRRLTAELSKAVAAEKYEECARLQREIEKLKK